jgi:hypothetical protein
MRHAFRALALALFGCVVVAGPAAANPFTWSPDVAISDPGSPFAAGCQGATAVGQSGQNFPGTKVEPWLAVDPSNNSRQITFWQQDRWSDGGANGLIEAYTIDGGATWVQPPVARQPKFSYCTGGSGVTGGYTRASDPWVTLSPNGNAWAMALQADIGLTTSNNNAMSVARSTDGGQSWDAPILLKRDTSFNTLNDKNSATADRLDSNYAYAIWDRLEFPNAQAAREAGEHAIGYRGPTWFSRTTNGSSAHPTWSSARIIYDPGEVNQTIGNQIVQTASGRLVDGFALIYNFKNAHKARGVNVAVLTSDDRGATWSDAKIVAPFVPGTVSGIRSGDIIPEIAADPSSENVYLIWQARAASGKATIMLSRSTNAGRSWSAPAVINARPDVDAFTPSISVAPNGVLTVTYYDLRAATAAQPYLTETRSIHSHDGGASWGDDALVDGPFDQSTAAVARGYFLGDYEGLGAEGTGGFQSGRVEADGTAATADSDVFGNAADSTP